jgi:hypothetical protein
MKKAVGCLFDIPPPRRLREDFTVLQPIPTELSGIKIGFYAYIVDRLNKDADMVVQNLHRASFIYHLPASRERQGGTLLLRLDAAQPYYGIPV